MHWPSPFKSGDNMFPKENDKVLTGTTDYLDTWKALEKLVKTGKTKAVGISNFSKAEVERLIKEGSIVPAAHQIELHPYLQQQEFLQFHKDQGIHVTAYSPFGNSNPIYEGQKGGLLMDDPVLTEIGKKYNKNGAQIALAWGVNMGHSVIPKSKTPSRLRANIESDFTLTKEEMEKIKGIDKKIRYNDPSESFGYKFYTDLDGKK
jgi:alcohol dehydrogenase (NADP+)